MEGKFFEKFDKIEQPPEKAVPEEGKEEKEKEKSPKDLYRVLTKTEESIEKKVFDSISFESLVKKAKTSGAFNSLLAAACLVCNSVSTRLSAEALEIPTQERPVVLSEEKEERTEKNVEERIKLFNSEIKLYKSLGYELELIEAITFYDKDSHDMEEITERLLREVPCFIGDPLIDLQWRHAIDKEVPLELSTKEGKIAFTPLSVTIERFNNEKMVKVYNWLKPEEPVLYEKILYGKDDEKTCDEVIKTISAEIKNFPQYEFLLEKMPVSEELKENNKFTFEFMKENTLPDETKEAIKKLLKEGSISVEPVPEGRQRDRKLRRGEENTVLGAALRKGYVLEIDDENKLRNPLRVNGYIKEITISYNLRLGDLKLSELRGILIDENRKVIDWIGDPKLKKDRYGNLVEIYYSHDDEQRPDTVKKIMVIHPSIVFSRDDNSEKNFSPVNLDLSELKLPNLENFIFQKNESPIEFLGPEKEYAVYSNMDHSYIKEQFGHYFESIEKGVSKAEEFFGFNPGEKIKNIFIVNAYSFNAFFHKRNPEVINLNDEILKQAKEKYISIDSVAFHEAIHGIDYFLRISENPGFKMYFKYLVNKDKEWFLSDLNEKKFFPDTKKGGHAQDNEEEFLASLINSLNHPQWEKAMKEKSKEFRELYLESLEMLYSILWEIKEDFKEDVKERLSKAPIFDILERKIKFLNSL